MPEKSNLDVFDHMKDYYAQATEQSKKKARKSKELADPVKQLLNWIESGLEDPALVHYAETPKMLRIRRPRLLKLLEEPYRKIAAVESMLKLMKVSPNLQRFQSELDKLGYFLGESSNTDDTDAEPVLYIVSAKTVARHGGFFKLKLLPKRI